MTAATKRNFKCPKCDRTFLAGPGLGSHMKTAHGIPGKALSTLHARRKKMDPVQEMLPTLEEEAPTVPETEEGSLPEKKLVCPECGQGFNGPQGPQALGRHRRSSHGVIGRYTKENIAAGVGVPKKRGRPRKEENQPTQLQPASPERLHHAQRHDSNNGEVHQPPALDYIAYALAVGGLKEFCRNFAESHGLPTREFTKQCAELFLRETRR
ncbi:MAG TPA: hypothetical protein VK638_00660 [Edaphobacter sp.]|nr:hypothetical protein [Edaphobacter sp.]